MVGAKSKVKAKINANAKGKAKLEPPAAATQSNDVIVRHCFMMHHLLFHHLYTYNKSVFNKLLVDGATAKWVDNVRGVLKGVSSCRDPRVQNRQMLEVDNWHDLFLPFALHCDAISCLRTGRTGSKSLDVLSWHGLLGQGSTMEVKQIITSVFKPCVGENTMDEVWRAICWSLRALYEGVLARQGPPRQII